MTAHTDVGAYAMGLLEERDRRQFEDHLAGCPACAAEVAELSPMAALLRGVELTGVEPAGAEGGEPAAGREPEGGDVTELLRRRARQQRQRRRWQVALGAAAGIVLIGGASVWGSRPHPRTALPRRHRWR